VWLENNGHPGLTIKLNAICRANTYTEPATWTQLAGKTVQALWADYTANPNANMNGKTCAVSVNGQAQYLPGGCVFCNGMMEFLSKTPQFRRCRRGDSIHDLQWGQWHFHQ
jgi:hypothetical protein